MAAGEASAASEQRPIIARTVVKCIAQCSGDHFIANVVQANHLRNVFIVVVAPNGVSNLKSFDASASTLTHARCTVQSLLQRFAIEEGSCTR